MRILVTGSSGTIGTRLCERLLQDGHQVTGVDWVVNKWKTEVNAVTVLCDLRDAEALQRLDLPACDAIVHLAANARVYELVENPDRARDNFLSTFNVLEYARTRGIKRFLFASSRECYGNLKAPSDQPSAISKKDNTDSWKLTADSSPPSFSEDMARIENCESPYTASKIGGEALVESYTRCYGVDHIIFRFSNVYGMYDDSVRVVPLFLKMTRQNKPIMVFGKDKCLDFTYIDDTVNGIVLALEKFDAAKNETYNLAYGEGTTIVDLAETVKKLVGSSSDINIGSPRLGEVIRYVADVSKAKERLGYNPKTPFSEGIRKTVEWYLEHT